jgi:hypothetical protein
MQHFEASACGVMHQKKAQGSEPPSGPTCRLRPPVDAIREWSAQLARFPAYNAL